MASPTILKVGILIVSTTVAKGESQDLTTGLLRNSFSKANENTQASQWEIANTEVVQDNLAQIQKVIKNWTDGAGGAEKLNLVVTSGGTGFAESDQTPEAVSQLLQRHAPGLTHAMLSTSFSITPFAAMSRPIAGTRNSTIIITLPGSPKGATENLEAVIKLLPHACIQTAGLQPSRQLHSGGVKKLEADAGITQTLKPSHTTLATEGVVKEPGYHSCGHHHHAPKPHTNPSSQVTKPGESVTVRLRSSPWPMISVEEAHGIISKNTSTGAEIIPRSVDSSLIGYILAYDITAPVPVPAYRASIVDGYAVIDRDGPGIYPVVTVSHAAPPSGEELPGLQSGQIARITTGAPLPPGATAVVMVEDTKLVRSTEDGKEELEVEILASNMGVDENVRQIGSDISMGSTILKKGTEITAVGGEIGLLASVGIAEVKVFRKPVVGVLSTGDEVVDHDKIGMLRLGEIRDSNRPTLIAAVKAWGFEAVDLGIAKDKADTLASILESALPKVDVLITTGGVSMGELDLLKPTIQHTLHGTIHFGRVAMKPGKPTTFATAGGKLIFALPGNPASALVTYHLFVLPALRQFTGHSGVRAHLPKVKVTLTEDIRLDPRAEYVRAVVRWGSEEGGLVASTTGGQRSSRVGSLLGANALLEVPALMDAGLGEKRRDRGVIPRGEKIKALMMGPVHGLV